MITLRDYQLSALDAVDDAIIRHGRTLMVMATGLGKTTTFGEWVRRRVAAGRRCLILAHREELIRQAAERVAAMTGAPCGIEMACESAHEGRFFPPPPVVVSSVQTLSRPARLSRFAADAFGGLVIDEAHHAAAASYRTILDHFTAEVLGVTATAVRGDRVRLGPIFRSVACDLGIPWAVDNGWSVPVHQKVVRVDGLDFSKVRTSAGDFSAADLDAVLSEEGPLHAVALPVTRIVGAGQGIVFCAGVRQAEALCAVLNRYKGGCAAWLCGETDKDLRRDLIARYRAGEVQLLVNVGVLTEGFDAPATEFIVMARPTRSLGLYVQMLGRATRTLPGVVDGLPDADARRAAVEDSLKPHCTVLDFVGSTNRLDPRQMTAADVFGEGESKEVRERAREILTRKDGGATRDALDRAREQVEAGRQLMAEIEARQKIKADAARYRVEDAGTIGVGDQRLPGYEPPATQGQRGLLYKLGVPWRSTERLTKRQASGWIGKLMREKGQRQESAA